jgi:hypothetical protein
MTYIKEKLLSLSSYFKGMLKEDDSEVINLEQLDKWFTERVVPIERDLNENINSIKTKINQEISQSKINLESLGNAELRNKREAPRIIQIMEGNREAYIQKVTVFINNIKIPDSMEDINNYTIEFGKAIDELNKSTMRSYMVLREFIEHDAYKVAQNLKKIDELIKEFDSAVNKREAVLVNSVKRRIPELKNKLASKERLTKELTDAEENLSQDESGEKDVESRMNKYKKSKEFSDYGKLNDELNTFVTRMKNHDSILSHNFALLEKALKNYSRMSVDEKLVLDYISSPVKTLTKDEKFKIIDILTQIKKLAVQDKLELKDKKREKTIQTVDVLNKEFLQEFLKKHNELVEQIDVVNKEIDASPVINETESLEQELKIVLERKKSSEEKLRRVKEDLGKINIDSLKELIEGNVNQLLDGNFKLEI